MLLVDTNVWLAAADRRSRDHATCFLAMFSTVAPPLLADRGWRPALPVPICLALLGRAWPDNVKKAVGLQGVNSSSR